MEIEAEAQRIINDIHEAFHGVRRGKVTLHEAEVLDGYGGTPEQLEARKLDTESRWEHVPDDHIANSFTVLCHVDPQSWRYYIAPYMIWSLRNFSTNYSVIIDHTIYTFELYEASTGLREHVQERFSLLDQPQSRCVCRFLRYMACQGDHVDDYQAKLALHKYWGQFCEGDGRGFTAVDQANNANRPK